MALLVIAIVLALIGVGGLAAGAADDDGADDTTTATPTSTTTTEGSSDTSSLVTVTTPTTGGGVTTTTRRTTATTRAPATATTQAAGACVVSAGSGNPGAVQAPPLGTFTYASCNSSENVDVVVTAGASSGGVTRRKITTKSQVGDIATNNAYGPSGAVQETATIAAFGFTLQCDWNPDIVEYPATLAVGTSWSIDSECNLGNGAKMKATGTRKITGVGSLVIGGTAVSGWTIESTEKLVVTAPNRSPSNFNATGTYLFDPTRGVRLHEKIVEDASGAVTQPKTTIERRLTNLTPKT